MGPMGPWAPKGPCGRKRSNSFGLRSATKTRATSRRKWAAAAADHTNSGQTQIVGYEKLSPPRGRQHSEQPRVNTVRGFARICPHRLPRESVLLCVWPTQKETLEASPTLGKRLQLPPWQRGRMLGSKARAVKLSLPVGATAVIDEWLVQEGSVVAEGFDLTLSRPSLLFSRSSFLML